jgi:hypothetical protein
MENEEQVKIKVLKGVNKKIKRKNIIISITSSLIVLLISIGVYTGIYLANQPKENPIKYNKNNFETSEGTAIEGETGKEVKQLFVTIRNTSEYGIAQSIVLKDENSDKASLYFYATEAKNKDKNESKIFGFSLTDKVHSPTNNGEIVEISKIYYLISDYYLPFDKENFEKDIKNAILIWEK